MVSIEIVQARLQALNEYATELDIKRSLPLKQILANKDAYYAFAKYITGYLEKSSAL